METRGQPPGPLHENPEAAMIELMGPLWRWGLAGLSALMASACATLNPYYDPILPHHRPQGFRNVHVEFEPKGTLTFVQWQWDAMRNGLPQAPAAPTPVVVLISHNHYDRLDEASVRTLHAQRGGPPLFVVPLGIGPPGWPTSALAGRSSSTGGDAIASRRPPGRSTSC